MILRADNLTKSYGSFLALDRLCLEIRPGEIVGLLGPNGSGKSTALRLMLGFLRPSAGRAWIAEHDCWSASHLARRHVTYLPGELRLYENMSGRQIVDFLTGLRPGIPIDDPNELAKRFDIDLSRPLSQLSSGMKRKVALLAVLTPRTPLVILDEPTNALDPTMRDLLLAQLTQLRQSGRTVLFSSHVLSEVEAICDRVAILRRGTLVHEQKVDMSRAAQQVRVTFGDGVDAMPALTGLSELVREGSCLRFTWTGPLAELMGWLATRSVTQLHIEPLGLAEVYRRFHAPGDG